MSFLSVGCSSSMLRVDTETECLLKELPDGASDIDDRVLLLDKRFKIPLFIMHCCTIQRPTHQGSLTTKKTIYKEDSKPEIMVNFQRFLGLIWLHRVFVVLAGILSK